MILVMRVVMPMVWVLLLVVLLTMMIMLVLVLVAMIVVSRAVASCPWPTTSGKSPSCSPAVDWLCSSAALASVWPSLVLRLSASAPLLVVVLSPLLPVAVASGAMLELELVFVVVEVVFGVLLAVVELPLAAVCRGGGRNFVGSWPFRRPSRRRSSFP